MILNTNDYTSKSSTTSGIQEAIDALPEAGGTIFIPSGTHMIRRSVVLRSRVTLRGEGPATILLSPKERRISLTKRTIKNKTHATLENTIGLKLGDELLIGDRTQGGYHARHGIIESIRGNVVNLDLLECDPERTYLPSNEAFATNVFPAIWLPRTHEVTIENLTIDGRIKKHRWGPRGNFTCAGIHARTSLDVRIINVNVRNWPGDGIGVQNGSALVTGCLTENCKGPGLHPGTNISNSIWSNNISRYNTTDGFFFCLGVQQTVVEGNLFYGNTLNGMANLTDPDRYNVLSGNICAENGMHGIEAKSAVGNTIQGNILRNNSQNEPGKFAGIYLENHRDNVVTGNTFIDDQDKPTQTQKIISLDPSGPNIIQDF